MSTTKVVTTASQGGTHFAYHVEVRARTGVCSLMGKSYGTDWAQFVPERSCIPPSAFHWMDRHFGLMTHPEAQAVAWMVTAYVYSYTEMSAIGIEARVVESKVEYQYRAAQTRTFPPIEHGAMPPTQEAEAPTQEQETR